MSTCWSPPMTNSPSSAQDACWAPSTARTSWRNSRPPECNRAGAEATVARQRGSELSDVKGARMLERRLHVVDLSALSERDHDQRIGQTGTTGQREIALEKCRPTAFLEHDEAARMIDAPALARCDVHDLDRLGQAEAGGHVEKRPILPERAVQRRECLEFLGLSGREPRRDDRG